MTFRINALPAEDFAVLHNLTDAELALRNARRMTVDACPGYPCRVSLQDAEPGETMILLNYVSMPAETPFRASHAIYVRQGATTATPAPGEVPEALSRRLLSIRLFGTDHMMKDADVIDGKTLASALYAAFADPQVAEVHIHNAKLGCFAARATRA